MGVFKGIIYVRGNAFKTYEYSPFWEEVYMKYTDFIRDFSLVLNENGIRITQPKLKELFDLLGEYVSDNIKDEGKIPIKEFMSFELVVVSPKKLPDGSWSDEQLSVKIKMSDKYKAELKNKLNK